MTKIENSYRIPVFKHNHAITLMTRRLRHYLNFTFNEVLACSHMRDNAWKLIKCYKQEQAGPMSRPGIIFISYLLIWPTSRPCLINSSTHRIVRPPANRPARNCRHCASIYLRSVSKLRAIGSTTNNLPIHLGGVSSADTVSLSYTHRMYLFLAELPTETLAERLAQPWRRSVTSLKHSPRSLCGPTRC